MCGDLLEAYSYVWVLTYSINQEVLRGENKDRLQFSLPWLDEHFPPSLDGLETLSYLTMADQTHSGGLPLFFSTSAFCA